MYEVDVLQATVASDDFASDKIAIQRGLAENRIGQLPSFDVGTVGRLAHFVECVLASAPSWESESAVEICRTAAEVAEWLSINIDPTEDRGGRMRLRAALLYELGDAPAIASQMLRDEDYTLPVRQFFSRTGPFHHLNGEGTPQDSLTLSDQTLFTFGAIDADVQEFARLIQTHDDPLQSLATETLTLVAQELSLNLTATDFQALVAVLRKRMRDATRSHVPTETLELLRAMQFPAELWSAQSSALDEGLLNPNLRSWGMASPTGTGKSFLTQVLLSRTLQVTPETLAIYLVPTKALVHEVTTRLRERLSSLGHSVVAVTPQLVGLEVAEQHSIEGASVLVLTPEKADLLLRISSELFDRTSLVIIDEAHNLESGIRGILLVMYLWRLKRILGPNCRFIFLSAVAPNIEDLVNWIGTPNKSLVHDRRPTRMRAGIYRIRSGKPKQGWIDYSDGVSLLVTKDKVANGVRRQLVQLAYAVGKAGPVLIVAKGKKECERLAIEMQTYLREVVGESPMDKQETASVSIQRLDSRLERELYSDVPMRSLLQDRIAYHHAGLPPRVRIGVEDAIRENHIRYVFATTTLAEGVNFPFASVVVQSLAIREAPVKGQPARYSPVTPRVFWNIAGRAGRPGADKEGQVILFEPSLGLEKINFLLNDYLNPQLKSIEPVTSALATGLSDIADQVDAGELSIDSIADPRLSESLPKVVHGVINSIRVSILHARAAGIASSPEEILDGTFAEYFLTSEQAEKAKQIVRLQGRVVDDIVQDPVSPSAVILAELGLSFETLSELLDFVRSREDWQISMLSSVLRGGSINTEQVQYVVGPVAARMAELEGRKLGGFLSPIILQWLTGIALSNVTTQFNQSVEDLVSVIYSRIQYLLPWGLYAFDRIVENEAKDRGIDYRNEIRSLAYLVDAGVPSFDALRLVNADIERVDATRLSRAYHDAGGLNQGLDAAAWVVSQSEEYLQEIIIGTDQRRVDYDFDSTILGVGWQ